MIEVAQVNTETVIAKFDRRAKGMRSRIAAKLSKIAGRLRIKIHDEKLSGQVLNVRTGKLRRSIGWDVSENGPEITARVFTNTGKPPYGKMHENGFQGTVTVREHLRMQKMAFGKAMMNPREVTVRSHTMKMNLPERSFMRSALREMYESGFITKEISEAV